MEINVLNENIKINFLMKSGKNAEIEKKIENKLKINIIT